MRKGLVRIDPAAVPELMLVARHNVLFFLTHDGRAAEAEQRLKLERPLYQELRKEAHLARLHWLEGSIAESLGRLKEAEVSLRTAKERIVSQQNLLDSAHVSRQLSLVLAKRGHKLEAKRLIDEAIPVFEALCAYPVAASARLLSLLLRLS